MRRLCAIFALALSFVGCAGRSEKGGVRIKEVAPTSEAECDTVNFGHIAMGETPFYEFAFRATGTPLTIISCESECGCVTVDYPHKPIAVGEVGVCRVEFHSAGQFGHRNYNLRFHLEPMADYTLHVKAVVE